MSKFEELMSKSELTRQELKDVESVGQLAKYQYLGKLYAKLRNENIKLAMSNREMNETLRVAYHRDIEHHKHINELQNRIGNLQHENMELADQKDDSQKNKDEIARLSAICNELKEQLMSERSKHHDELASALRDNKAWRGLVDTLELKYKNLLENKNTKDWEELYKASQKQLEESMNRCNRLTEELEKERGLCLPQSEREYMDLPPAVEPKGVSSFPPENGQSGELNVGALMNQMFREAREALAKNKHKVSDGNAQTAMHSNNCDVFASTKMADVMQEIREGNPFYSTKFTTEPQDDIDRVNFEGIRQEAIKNRGKEMANIQYMCDEKTNRLYHVQRVARIMESEPLYKMIMNAIQTKQAQPFN